jgi:hypothetical protein
MYLKKNFFFISVTHELAECIYNNYVIKRIDNKKMLVENIASEIFFCWFDIFIIGGGKKKIFSTYMYLPIGQIAESERGNKKYFDLGLKAF